MNNSKQLLVIVTVMIALIASSCTAIGDIFKAGMGFGIIIFIIIIAIIIAIVSRFTKK